MYTSALLPLLPLLALPLTSGLPHQTSNSNKLPLPALLRRQGLLDLPPSLNTISVTNDPSTIPTSTATIEDDNMVSIINSQPTPKPSAIPSLWQINTVPQTLIAQNQNQGSNPKSTDKANIQEIDEGNIDDGMIAENVSDNNVESASPIPTMSITMAEYPGDSLLQPTSVSMVGVNMDITAAAITAAAITGDPTVPITAEAAAITGNPTLAITEAALNTGSITGSSITSGPTITSSPTSIFSGTITNWSASATTSSTPAQTSTSTNDSINAAGMPTSTSTSSASTPTETDSTKKGKKIRYKHCSETKGTITEIKIEPCEGGKGTILDPCHFQSGKNYTISLSYVSPQDSVSPRSNLLARDKTISDGQEEYFTYPGQAFDACQYTTCPIKKDETQIYTYNFQTLNNRFDQLTFNMTNGLDGDSLMCAYFPITFMPSMAGRSVKRNIPFGGLGSRW
ncbi:uncharacterized protein L201_006363 [Kwoniella dendrophila CBS 6074]|uniref:Phosphatidylglycerol/phosphatidylinositol transfer protein n=1 Tax=Kwoniella dendrophila CBS 6074 TaxID=1295534 RepID=A0AAX4K1J3_9TREE